MSFETESRVWQAEVDEEAARLVRLGVPPWDALIQARQRVTARRRREADPNFKPAPPVATHD